VNPFGNQSSKYFMWPVLLLLYNLPSWLLTNFFFISLVLLIPGEKAPTGEKMDVFLMPLIKDLLKLWEGVPAFDASKPAGERDFSMRGVLFWTVNDFLAYGLLSGQQTKGYKGCPICYMQTYTDYSTSCKKMVYLGMRCWLCPEHRMRRARAAFNNFPQHDPLPVRPTGDDIRAMAQEREAYLAAGRVEDGDEDPVKRYSVKRLSAFYLLLYRTVHNHLLLNPTMTCFFPKSRCATVNEKCEYVVFFFP
jgi:hypothetical protein